MSTTPVSASAPRRALALGPITADRLATQAGAEVNDAADAYRRWSALILGYLRAQGANDPEDLLGEVFYCVARDLHSVRGDEDAIRRWIFTVARNRLVDDHRRRSRRPRPSGANPPDVPAADEGPHTLDPTLIAALRQLTPRQREVVVLRFVADLSLLEVARITHRPVGAVKALQRRGLARLREVVSAEM